MGSPRRIAPKTHVLSTFGPFINLGILRGSGVLKPSVGGGGLVVLGWGFMVFDSFLQAFGRGPSPTFIERYLAGPCQETCSTQR
eukprot:549972-Amphidinium_carterae.1